MVHYMKASYQVAHYVRNRVLTPFGGFATAKRDPVIRQPPTFVEKRYIYGRGVCGKGTEHCPSGAALRA